MPRTCEICGKGTATGFKVSHSNIKTKRRWKVNIQKIRTLVEGRSRRIKVCCRCIKSNKVKQSV